MLRLPFFKLSPGGNITVIVQNTPDIEQHKVYIAKTVLSEQHIGAEQMGFADFAAPCLEMAGGEFCVNALRSFAVLLFRRGLLNKNSGSSCGLVACSGLPLPALVEVADRGDFFDSSVEFSLGAAVRVENVAIGENIVFLPGIVHLLLEQDKSPMPETWELLCEKAAFLRRKYNLEAHGAVGCVWWSKNKGGYSINPLVWVREPASLCLENSCGSGSLALAVLHNSSGMEIMQPGGSSLLAGVREANNERKAFVGGPVAMIAEGDIFISGPAPKK